MPTAKPIADQFQTRRQGRRFALQLLFQFEFHHHLDQWVEDFWIKQIVTAETRQFSERLVEGVLTNQECLDRLISDYAIEWKVERMPVVDRNILRCALFELLWMNDVPAKVTMNEAIELAKRFADDETKRFVNAMLDHILQDDPRLQEKRAEMNSVVKKFSGSDDQPTSTKNHSVGN